MPQKFHVTTIKKLIDDDIRYNSWPTKFENKQNRKKLYLQNS